GRVAGTAAAPATIDEECFDDAVFERMKRNDHQSPVRFDDAFGRAQCRRQFGELVVDEDAQRLKRARGRMNVVRTRANNRRNGVRERAGRFKRNLRALFDDGPRNGARMTLFPENEYDIGEVTLADVIDNIRRARAVAAHAHVEGAIKTE